MYVDAFSEELADSQARAFCERGGLRGEGERRAPENATHPKTQLPAEKRLIR